MLPCDEKSVAGEIDFSVLKLLRLIQQIKLGPKISLHFQKTCWHYHIRFKMYSRFGGTCNLSFDEFPPEIDIFATFSIWSYPRYCWLETWRQDFLFIHKFVFSFSKIPDIDVLNHPGWGVNQAPVGVHLQQSLKHWDANLRRNLGNVSHLDLDRKRNY